MQTRKRAKSVSFGKKKEKAEKEHVKKTAVEEKVIVSDKAEETEVKAQQEKPQTELSDTPPKDNFEIVGSDIETPTSEFVSDNPLSTTPELPKSKEAEEAVDEEKSEDEPAKGSELIKPEETTAQETSAPVEKGPSEELSSTLPPSAFTIQSNEQGAEEAPAAAESESIPESASESTPVSGTGKKRFGLYFLVVAFISFILGLGAMAGASYLGLVNSNLPKLPTTIPVIGQMPTLTAVPPKATPIPKPVDLSALTIAVLNGSGISGKAADVKTTLTTAGFTVKSTGNADKSTYTKTEISAKKTVKHEYLTKLEDTLNKAYDVDTTVGTSPDSDTTDVTVTLGQPTSK